MTRKQEVMDDAVEVQGVRSAIMRAVDAYDEACLKCHGQKPGPLTSMSEANKLTLAPMIMAAVEAFSKAAPPHVEPLNAVVWANPAPDASAAAVLPATYKHVEPSAAESDPQVEAIAKAMSDAYTDDPKLWQLNNPDAAGLLSSLRAGGWTITPLIAPPHVESRIPFGREQLFATHVEPSAAAPSAAEPVLIITSHFHGKAIPLTSALFALAAQEGNDGDEGNAMQAAAERILALETALRSKP